MSLFELRSEPGAAASRSPRRAAGVAVVDRRGPTGGGTPWGTLVAIALLAAAGLAMVAGPAVVNGDATQVDLPAGQRSGLAVVEEILSGIQGIEFCHLGARDVVRHKIVQDIVEAYRMFSEQRAQAGE